MNAASVILDFYDPRDAVFPFGCRHPPCEVVAVKRGVRIRAYESVLDFHRLTIVDDPGNRQALFGRRVVILPLAAEKNRRTSKGRDRRARIFLAAVPNTRRQL
ncbi:MAG: hypothetical protein ABW346_10135, partial [Terrimicrobium sp.]